MTIDVTTYPTGSTYTITPTNETTVTSRVPEDCTWIVVNTYNKLQEDCSEEIYVREEREYMRSGWNNPRTLRLPENKKYKNKNL